MNKYETSRQVSRNEKRLDAKAQRKGAHGRGGYSDDYLRSVRYVPAENRGKTYPFGSKKQGFNTDEV